MPLISFDALPDSAKLWIFAAEKPVNPTDIQPFLSNLDTFLDEWQAHGKALAAGRDLRFGQFLMIGADENVEAPSGCSIDTLTRAVVEVGKMFGVNFLSSALIAYRDGETIRTTDRQSFKNLIRLGKVTHDTIVYNHTLSKMSELRDGKWETAAEKSWHGIAFTFPVAA